MAPNGFSKVEGEHTDEQQVERAQVEQQLLVGGLKWHSP